jgi:hypothetical protein
LAASAASLDKAMLADGAPNQASKQLSDGHVPLLRDAAKSLIILARQSKQV